MDGNDAVPLIKHDGSPFDSDEVKLLSGQLGQLGTADRVKARDANAEKIAVDDAARMLVVSGPGTGKSTLFKARLQHWLEKYGEERLVVATFVKKLVRDLNEDISTDESISNERKSRVTVTTLHGLARSIIERNHGTQELPLRAHCLVITPMWEEMVWLDAVSVQGEHKIEDFAWATLRESLYDGEPSTEAAWATLRETHHQLEQFYNALTFTDLILLATQAIIENRELAEGTLFIIDEFQDFNLAEERLIQELTAESPGVLLAGDDDQVLYDKLRRGHASIIRGYYRATQWVNAMLPFCGRCGFHICAAAESFLADGHVPESIEKVFLPLAEEAESEKVTVVVSTTPKSGVEYIERFLEHHRPAIEERRDALRAKTKKDAYLLILTPARELNFLKPGGARERLRDLVRDYLAEDERLSEVYWKLVDYFHAGIDPAQNFALRRVLAHEQVDQATVTGLLRQALEANLNLCDLDHPVIKGCLEKSASVRTILESDGASEQKAAGIATLGGFGDADDLTRELELRPLGQDPSLLVEEPEPEQKDTVGAVEITTIVGAKGLSADHVIVLGCDSVNLAPISRSAFFVALTRARKSLTLLACMGGGGAAVLHEFIYGLPEHHTRACQAKTGGAIREFETVADLQTHLAKTEYAKRMAAKKRTGG